MHQRGSRGGAHTSFSPLPLQVVCATETERRLATEEGGGDIQLWRHAASAIRENTGGEFVVSVTRAPSRASARHAAVGAAATRGRRWRIRGREWGWRWGGVRRCGDRNSCSTTRARTHTTRRGVIDRRRGGGGCEAEGGARRSEFGTKEKASSRESDNQQSNTRILSGRRAECDVPRDEERSRWRREERGWGRSAFAVGHITWAQHAGRRETISANNRSA